MEAEILRNERFPRGHRLQKEFLVLIDEYRSCSDALRDDEENRIRRTTFEKKSRETKTRNDEKSFPGKGKQPPYGKRTFCDIEPIHLSSEEEEEEIDYSGGKRARKRPPPRDDDVVESFSSEPEEIEDYSGGKRAYKRYWLDMKFSEESSFDGLENMSWHGDEPVDLESIRYVVREVMQKEFRHAVEDSFRTYRQIYCVESRDATRRVWPDGKPDRHEEKENMRKEITALKKAYKRLYDTVNPDRLYSLIEDKKALERHVDLSGK